MGCDIHAMVEVRADGRWTAITKPVFKSSYRNEATSDPYDGRNYDLFAILANVRNGYGFAGVSTGTGWKPIAEPRGIPGDCSPEYADSVEGYGIDGHSHSWLTVADLDGYDWQGQTTTKHGVFSEGEYVRSIRTGEIHGYSGGVSGASVVVMEPEEYEAMLGVGFGSKNSRDCTKSYYIAREWPSTAAVQADGFYTDTLPVLRTLGAPDDVRLVFYFDN